MAITEMELGGGGFFGGGGKGGGSAKRLFRDQHLIVVWMRRRKGKTANQGEDGIRVKKPTSWANRGRGKCVFPHKKSKTANNIQEGKKGR